MKEEQFKNLTRPQQWQGIKASAVNSVELYKSARLLAKQKKYGVATSLLILAMEEAVKCLVLRSQYSEVLDDNLKIPLDRIFRHHKDKHDKGLGLNDITLVMSAVSKIGTRIQKNNVNIGSALLEAGMVFIKSQMGKDKLEKWWEDADKDKQSGFYVDFKGIWKTPQEIDQDEYKTSHYYVSHFIDCVKNIDSLKEHQDK